jgi:uncharacterized protein YgfB (UPF0149 family)
MAKRLPQLTDVSKAITCLNIEDNASSAHGILCGMAIVKGQVNLDEWLKEVIVSVDFDDLAQNQAHQQLSHLFERTIGQLNDPVLRFELLISDEVPLSEQFTALKNWISGFIFGLGFGKIKTKNKEVVELISTLSTIANTKDELEENEENESDFYEIEEFVRMGVLFIQEELHHNQQSIVGVPKH